MLSVSGRRGYRDQHAHELGMLDTHSKVSTTRMIMAASRPRPIMAGFAKLANHEFNGEPGSCFTDSCDSTAIPSYDLFLYQIPGTSQSRGPRANDVATQTQYGSYSIAVCAHPE